MKSTTPTPIVSISRHGYQRTTLSGRKSIYPINTRIDPTSHAHLEGLQTYYNGITGLKVRPSVIMRRALAVLAGHIKDADPIDEQAAIVDCSHHLEEN